MFAKRKKNRFIINWTKFGKYDRPTLVLSVQASHGRSTPLLRMTV